MRGFREGSWVEVKGFEKSEEQDLIFFRQRLQTAVFVKWQWGGRKHFPPLRLDPLLSLFLFHSQFSSLSPFPIVYFFGDKKKKKKKIDLLVRPENEKNFKKFRSR